VTHKSSTHNQITTTTTTTQNTHDTTSSPQRKKIRIPRREKKTGIESLKENKIQPLKITTNNFKITASPKREEEEEEETRHHHQVPQTG
jgi:hypothetical protein